MNQSGLHRRTRKIADRLINGVHDIASTRFQLYADSTRSDLRVDIVIPAAPKDLDVLPTTIDSARRNLRHPIGSVFVISPRTSTIEGLCRTKGCVFVDERSILELDPAAIDLVVNGEDRSGWIYQQFLKWGASKVVQTSHFLIMDADTALVRPQVFERNGRIVFNYSDEYHQPYFDMYRRLLNEAVTCPVSFTSHHMLYDSLILAELKARIESIHGRAWPQAILRCIDRKQPSAVSDYDNYGQYVFLHHGDGMAIEYWSNLRLRRSLGIPSASALTFLFGGRYKSVSFHSHAY